MAEDRKEGKPLILVGIGLGVLYWVVESFLYVFLSNDLNFFNHLFSPDAGALYRRLIVISLMVLFSSHCQGRLRAMREEVDEWMNYSQQLESQNPGAAASPPGE